MGKILDFLFGKKHNPGKKQNALCGACLNNIRECMDCHHWFCSCSGRNCNEIKDFEGYFYSKGRFS